MATFSGIHFDASTLGVRLTHAEYVSGTGFDQKITTPADARESTHELKMVRAGRLNGKITAATGGAAIQGARIFVGENYSDAAPQDFSTHAGTYLIHGVRPGSATVTVHASGYAPELKEVQVAAGGETTLNVALSAGQSIEGVVKDDKGTPVAGAELVATAWRSKGTLGLRAMTDASGAFHMDNAPVDAFEVMVDAPGRPPHTQTVQAGKVVVAVTLPAASSVAPRAGVLSVGEAAPAVTVTALDGQKIALNELRDKFVLLDFWATWCPPCVEEQTHFVTIQQKHGGRKDFMILGISRDFEVPAVRDHLANSPKINWPQVVGNAAGVRQACEAFGVKGLPEVFLIGPDGRIIANRLRGEEIERAVDEALKGKSPG
jgi:thiol-disulfide isomerase/thioredoxin